MMLDKNTEGRVKNIKEAKKATLLSYRLTALKYIKTELRKYKIAEGSFMQNSLSPQTDVNSLITQAIIGGFE